MSKVDLHSQLADSALHLARSIPSPHPRADMTEQRIAVKLIGPDDDGGLVSLDSLTAFCRSLSKCLRCADAIVRPDAKRLRFRVVELRASSALIAVEPRLPSTDTQGKAVVEFFRDTVSRLQSGKVVDHRLTFDDLEAFRDLASPLGAEAKSVWVNGFQITSRYTANIDRILRSAIPSEGQVTGRLETIYAHDRNDFVLFPLAGPPVTCSFQDPLFEQVRRSLRQIVTVYGTLYFQPDKPLPHRVRVARIEIHPPNDKLPRLRDLRGIAKRCTGKMSSVDFVRAIRDE